MNPPNRAAKSSRLPPKEWLYRKLDIPVELLDGGVGLELRGRRSLAVHGCTRIMDFSPEEVRLALGMLILSVRGEGLLCTSFLSGDVGVEGIIHSLTLEEREGKEC